MPPYSINEFINSLLVFRFVCLWFYVILENFSLIWRRHHYLWRSSKSNPSSALMAIDQWRFFSVPLLLCLWWASPRTPGTCICCQAVTTCLRDRTPNSRMQGERSTPEPLAVCPPHLDLMIIILNYKQVNHSLYSVKILPVTSSLLVRHTRRK